LPSVPHTCKALPEPTGKLFQSFLAGTYLTLILFLSCELSLSLSFARTNNLSVSCLSLSLPLSRL